MTKILFVDLDGTIREPKSGAKFISELNPYDQRIIEGADKAIAHYYEHGWHIVGISNQGGIAAGHRSFESVVKEMQYTLELVPQLHSIYFCPDFEGNECWYVSRNEVLEEGSREEKLIGKYRKPNSGMIELVLMMIEDEGSDARDTSMMVGDRPEDKEAAINAGINFQDAIIWRSEFV